MTHDSEALDDDVMDVLLEGGPADLRGQDRRRRAPSSQDKIKVPYLGGYEHFERTGETTERGGARLMLYRWTTRTRIAE